MGGWSGDESRTVCQLDLKKLRAACLCCKCVCERGHLQWTFSISLKPFTNFLDYSNKQTSAGVPQQLKIHSLSCQLSCEAVLQYNYYKRIVHTNYYYDCHIL